MNETEVAVGIFYRESKILMGKRAASEGRFAGYWEFPGGTVEVGERPEQTLQREFMEELGVELKQFQALQTREVFLEPRRYKIYFFQVCFSETRCECLGKNAHSEFRWLSFEEALQLQLTPANKEVLEYYRKHPLSDF